MLGAIPSTRFCFFEAIHARLLGHVIGIFGTVTMEVVACSDANATGTVPTHAAVEVVAWGAFALLSNFASVKGVQRAQQVA